MTDRKNHALKAYFGDLHNHCSMGVAKGSIERIYDIARHNLDFVCHTPHSQFPDLEKQDMPQQMIDYYKEGFSKVSKRWDTCMKLCNTYHEPGRFVTFLGLEWHSAFWGDYCVIMPKDNIPLEYLPYDQMLEWARKINAVVIPHHPAYKLEHRGSNAAHWDTALMPVLEIFSEHGNSECDTAPVPYYSHSMGGRTTRNTYQHYLAQGYKIGAIAGTDDHLGYPAAYGEGMSVILSPALTREALLQAIRQRHTYAVSGDRILLDFSLNNSIMGTILPYEKKRDISVGVTGWDFIDRIEVLKNNKVMHREFPEDTTPSTPQWDKPVILRIEYGWGVFSGGPIYDWDIQVRIIDGAILEHMKGFQSGPFDETRRDQVTEIDDTGLRITSFTSRVQALRGMPTKCVALKVKGKLDTEIVISLKKPFSKTIKKKLGDLALENDIFLTAPYPAPALTLHRLVFAGDYQSQFSITDKDPSGEAAWYYVRLNQKNGQLAVSSPIWVE